MTRTRIAGTNYSFGINITIKFDEYLQPNETEQVEDYLDLYISDLTESTTNCLESVDITSTTINNKTIINAIISSCDSESQQQLIANYNQTILERDIIEIEGVGDPEIQIKVISNEDEEKENNERNNDDQTTTILIIIGCIICCCCNTFIHLVCTV